ncbi:MAG TPA: dUTP diphosphatase [Dehalococcoidia bacterium]|nr:dUTP diphosphatase [Dehalococcoidia bacterium]
MTDAPDLQVKRLRPSATMPQRATPHASGLDLYADLTEAGGAINLSPQPQLIPTGIAVAVPSGYEVQLRPRSGLSRRGVVVAFGTIDADYRGEVFVNMSAPGAEGGRFLIEHGDRIAQLVVAPIVLADVVEVDELSDTERGAGGFGSTGR